MHYVAVMIFFFALPLVAGAATPADKFMPGTPYYFESFDPGLQPWEPGQPLNIEEVFKNYQYYEIVFDQRGDEITVSQYVRGVKTRTGKYSKLPDGSLGK
jgi:hypothetical protein